MDRFVTKTQRIRNQNDEEAGPSSKHRQVEIDLENILSDPSLML